MKKNSVIEWLANYLNKPKLTEENLKQTLHFSLLWHLFERIYFTEFEVELKPDILIERSNQMCDFLADEDLNTIFDFLRKRYTAKNEIDNRKFDKLKFKSQNNANDCKRILTANDSSKQEKAQTVFLIIHRFRNNLFHGEKNTIKLDTCEEAFKVINTFLMCFIEIKNNQQIKTQ